MSAPGEPPPAYTQASASSFITDLERLVDLKNQGMLSDGEFTLAKKKVIALTDDPLEQNDGPYHQSDGQVKFKWVDGEVFMNDSGSGARVDVHFSRPMLSEGEYCIGFVAHTSRNNSSVLVISNVKEGVDVRRPVATEKIWTDAGSGKPLQYQLWKPVPPGGFVAMSDIPNFKTNDSNNIHNWGIHQLWCVAEKHVQHSRIGKRIWWDAGTSARQDGSIWEVESTHFMIGQGDHGQPHKNVYGMGRNVESIGPMPVPLFHGKQVVQFRVSDSKCNDELDDYHFWLAYDGHSYQELPMELQQVQGFMLNHWQSILDDLSQIINTERCDCPLCCLMSLLCTIVVGCVYCQKKGENVKREVIAKCRQYDDDWSSRFGINVIPATVHPSYIQFPAQGQKHIHLTTLKDRGTISIQLHITPD